MNAQLSTFDRNCKVPSTRVPDSQQKNKKQPDSTSSTFGLCRLTETIFRPRAASRLQLLSEDAEEDGTEQQKETFLCCQTVEEDVKRGFITARAFAFHQRLQGQKHARVIRRR